MKPSELLKAAYAILAEGPHRWTKGALARNCSNSKASPCSSEASCFCGLGVLDRVISYSRIYPMKPEHREAQNKLELVANGDWVDFNDADETTYEQMLAKYREAIELAEQVELDDSPEV